MSGINVSRLTDKHRLVIRNYYGDGTHETGLYADINGDLRVTSTGWVIRWADGDAGERSSHIVRVIEPRFESKPGMVLTLPGLETETDNTYIAVRLPDKAGGPHPWLASYALAESLHTQQFPWYTDDEVADFVAEGLLVEVEDNDD